MVGQFTQKSNPYPHWEFLDKKENLRIRVVPEKGGLISEWRINEKDLLYLDLDSLLDDNKSIRGGIPVLFPICGPGGKFTFSNATFKLNQHGFARNMPWEIQLLDDGGGFSLRLIATSKTLTLYPYNFEIIIQIRPIKNILKLTTLITNNSNDVMPFNFGFHPYFQVEDLENMTITGLPENCIDHLTMDSDQTFKHLNNLFRGVDFCSIPAKEVVLLNRLNGNKLEMQYQAPFNRTVVWTDPPRQMVCLEPWTSPRYSLVHGDGILFLAPGASKELNCQFLSN